MKILMKIEIPVETGNTAVINGALGTTIQAILEEQKPESAYFIASNGMRCGLIVVNMKDASEIPSFAEPWFLAFNARVEFFPTMTPDDLAKAGPSIEAAAKIIASPLDRNKSTDSFCGIWKYVGVCFKFGQGDIEWLIPVSLCRYDQLWQSLVTVGPCNKINI